MYETGTTILKRDALGWIGYPRGRREALLDEFERSGLKGAAFARTVGIHCQTFANWIQKRRHARGGYGVAGPGPGLSWLDAALPQAEVATPVPAPAPVLAESSAPPAVELRCGTRLLLGDARRAGSEIPGICSGGLCGHLYLAGVGGRRMIRHERSLHARHGISCFPDFLRFWLHCQPARRLVFTPEFRAKFKFPWLVQVPMASSSSH